MSVEHWSDIDWPERMLGRCTTAPVATLPRPGSLWLSRATGRRATLLWASQGSVCLSYDETRITSRKIHRLTDFARLYTEAI